MDDTQVDLLQLIRASQTDHRIDVVGLAKKLGLNVYSIDLPDDRSGCIKRDAESGDAFIEVNRNHPVSRQRFTVAHEIAHFIKHPEVLAKKGQLDRAGVFKDDHEIKLEEEADEEAAAILMPEYLVDEYFTSHEWDKHTRFDAGMIHDVAEHFRVSRAMAVTRLRNLDFPVPYISFA